MLELRLADGTYVEVPDDESVPRGVQVREVRALPKVCRASRRAGPACVRVAQPTYAMHMRSFPHPAHVVFS